MAHVLNLDMQGTTPIALASGDIALMDYTPFTPKVTAQQIIAALKSGGEIPLVLRRNIEDEPAKVIISAADADALAATINSIEALFLMAELYQEKKLGVPVYRVFQPDGLGTSWRSEILTGRVEFDRRILDMQWINRKIEVTIYWTRRFYSEGDEVELALSTGGVALPGGATIFNDSQIDPLVNYVICEPEGGVLPAPARIEITNLVNDSTRNYTYYLNQNIWSNPGAAPHLLQAESATGGSTVAAGTSSGGQHRTVSWVGDTSQEVLTWTLSTDTLNALGGNYVRLLARFVTITAGIWLKWRVKLEASTIYETEETRTGTEALQSLETLQLPPYLVGAGDLYPLTLTLCARKAGGGSFALDFVQLGVLDGFRRLHPRTYGQQYNARLVDDGMLGLVYKDGAATPGKSGHYRGEGKLELWPNRPQSIYFLWTREDGTAPIARSISVRIYWRPRALTI